MRTFFWFIVSSAILILANRGVAQDSLLYNNNPLTLTQSTTIDAFVPVKWRVSGSFGYHQLSQKGYLNENLYLTHGFQATLATDYFVGRNWGLGVLLGYQNLSVSDLYRQDPSIPQFPTPRILPLTSLHSFMLTAGPAFSFPLSPRLRFDLDIRGGVFYNDAPVLGAYISGSTLANQLTGVLVTAVVPSDQRFRAGFNASAGLKYQLTQQFGVGLSANASMSSFGYTQVNSSNNFFQKRIDLNMYGAQIAVSYRFLSNQRQRSSPVPATSPKPVCYPPILDPAQASEFEVGSSSRPVFRWRSSAPIYTEGERYTFRLYTLPGNKLLYERTGKESQIVWPTQLPLPDSTSYYFYSVSTVRSDDFEQTCSSEPVAGALGFYKQQPLASQNQAPAPRELAPSFTLKLYEMRLVEVPVSKVTPKSTKSVKRTSKTVVSRKPTQTKPISQSVVRTDSIRAIPVRPDSVRSDSAKLKPVRSDSIRSDSARLRPVLSDSIRSDSARSNLVRSDSIRADSTRSNLIRRDSIRADSVRSSLMRADSVRSAAIRADSVRAKIGPVATRIVFSLLYEGPTQELNFTWPSSVPLPDQPTVYQYTINRISSQQILLNHYVVVEPDGCSTIIDEATKNKRLYYNSPFKQPPVKELPPLPANKGKP